MSDVNQLLDAIKMGDEQAARKLLPLVYGELRSLAAKKLRQEKPGQTLQATALVHEAYMRLVGNEDRWENKGHFFAAAAEAMRRILVERARKKRRAKHGGERTRTELDESLLASEPREDLLLLDEALNELEHIKPEAAEVVKLRYFAGQSLPDISQILQISESTCSRHWRYARVWLKERLDR